MVGMSSRSQRYSTDRMIVALTWDGFFTVTVTRQCLPLSSAVTSVALSWEVTLTAFCDGRYDVLCHSANTGATNTTSVAATALRVWGSAGRHTSSYQASRASPSTSVTAARTTTPTSLSCGENVWVKTASASEIDMTAAATVARLIRRPSTPATRVRIARTAHTTSASNEGPVTTDA